MSRLFLIVGNSGSGKDSLIWEVQKNFPKDMKSIKVPKRVITRPPSPETEDFESADESTFLKIKEKGGFALDWHIYNLYYGVRKNIEEWLAEGHPVLINVSRKIIDMARDRYPDLRVIFVKVPYEITAQRIKERGRENEEKMKARLERARKNQDFPSADFTVDNSGDLETAGQILMDYIISEVKQAEKQ
ncbi:MAG: phosphonate metabolism protein/1,5-bisphosphokinase (PRPP-forming) PhnN [Candidatus Lokiarchaeota archaeon]|nr:phosphonate metabolism protein/1,5-bisphosphokinase (PRPP-forming) PhnN [Candidatus Lokiarchaeota archaeon]